MPVTVPAVLPGDFCCIPMAPPAGPFVAIAEWVNDLGTKGDSPQDYGHAEVYAGLPDKAGPYGYTFSAYPNKMGKRALPCPPAQLPGSLWSSGLVTLTQAQRQAVVAWCVAHPAVTYSGWDYLELTAHRIGIDTSWLEARIADSSSYICSQYVDASYQAAGKQLFNDGRWNGFVTPLDLALLLESLRK
jgi:hypothetical protein